MSIQQSQSLPLRAVLNEVDGARVIAELLTAEPDLEDWVVRFIDRVGAGTPFPLTAATLAGSSLWHAARWYLYAKSVQGETDKSKLYTRFLAGLLFDVSELRFIEARDEDGPNGEPGVLWHDLGEVGLPQWLADHPRATVEAVYEPVGTKATSSQYRASILVLMLGDEAVGLLDVDLPDVLNPPEAFHPQRTWHMQWQSLPKTQRFKLS